MISLIELIKYNDLSMVMALIISLVITIKISWFIYTVRWRHLPTVPGCYPFIGHMFNFPNTLDIIKYKKKQYEQYGDSVLLWVFTKPFFMTRDPKIIQYVVSSPELLAKASLYWALTDWLQDGLLVSTGQKWKKRRRELTKLFHFNNLKGYCEMIEKHSHRLVEKLRGNKREKLEMFRQANEYTLGITCEILMGINADSNEVKVYAECLRVILKNVATRFYYPWRWFNWSFKCFQTGQEYFKHINENHNLVKKIIEERIEYRKRNLTTEGRIFIDILLDLYEKDEIDVDGIVEEVSTFMFGGHDTVSTCLAWCLYLLGRNPECQQKAYEEAQRISKYPNYSLHNRIKAMKYIECVVKETLRIYSPVPSIGRSVKKDIVINGMLIPKGTDIVVDFLTLHRNKRYWKNPMSFNPDRFDESVNYSTNNAFLFLPFSAGQRNCIGQKFAMLEMKITVYHILLNFEIFASQKEADLREIVEGVLTTVDGLHVSLNSR